MKKTYPMKYPKHAPRTDPVVAMIAIFIHLCLSAIVIGIIKTSGGIGKIKLSIKDIGIVELNEAFASQSLACIKDLEIDINKVNLDGGAIALGHPLGATGARITGKAAQLLKRENKKYALATQCIGLGMGIATVIEAV